MDVLHSRCCGLDVHQKTVTACVAVSEENGKKSKEVRTFGTWTKDLERLAKWLMDCRSVAARSAAGQFRSSARCSRPP